MSAITDIKEQVTQVVSTQIESLKRQLFGVNSERLDFFMDSFYKLSPRQRILFSGGVISMVIAFVVTAISLYFVQIGSLRSELNESFSALHRIHQLKLEEKVEAEKFDQLESSVKRKTKGLAIKPFFERLSREINVNISNLREDKIDIDSSNPLSEKLKQLRVSMKLPKISIPKLMNFLVETEKSGKYLRVSDIKITGMYGNKLFFDANVVIRGYSVAR